MTSLPDIAAKSFAPPPEPQTLIDALLAEQRTLTAVERFAHAHARHQLPVGEKNYRRLLPATAPAPGQQYAFEVDLDQCSGCKACVTACHSLNGLDETETWRSVGLLVSDSRAGERLEKGSRGKGVEGISPFSPRPLFPSASIQQHVTTACHHCADPGCANGCPVLAYDKDPVTGIVRHLDDQCIGCSYCVMKCPYEVPQYSAPRGIVRKCDMCSQRLAVGEAPACVQACPNEAIKITLVDLEGVRAKYFRPDENTFLPDSPAPSITKPTTRYRSTKLAPNLIAADHAAPRLDHPHWPLVLMLVLTQSAAGLFLAATIAASAGAAITALTATGFALLNVGLIASVLHLGQPLKAWRAFLGWRKSWLSREIIAFNLFAGAALLAILLPRASILASAIGLAAVFTSAMVYVDTHRPFWCARIAFGNFYGTTLLLGATLAAVAFGWRGQLQFAQPFAIAALVIRTTLFVWRRLEVRRALRDSANAIHLNARAIRELLPWTTPVRTGLFLGSTAFGLLAIFNVAQLAPVWATGALLTTAGSEIIARYVFFAAGASQRMPGGFAA